MQLQYKNIESINVAIVPFSIKILIFHIHSNGD